MYDDRDNSNDDDDTNDDDSDDDNAHMYYHFFTNLIIISSTNYLHLQRQYTENGLKMVNYGYSTYPVLQVSVGHR
jgi:hypothetical protein